MIKRMLMLTCIALVAVLGVVTPAHAYPPGGTVVVTDKSSYPPGSTVTITASGFEACAGQLVTFTITPPGGGTPITLTAIADAKGTAVVTLTAPGTTGVYSVTATSAGPCDVATTSFTVAKRPGGGLPSSGTDAARLATTSAALVFTGLGLWLVARRRRRHVAAA